MNLDNKQIAIIFIGVIVILSLVLNYFNPQQINEYVVTTGFGAIVALAVPLGSGKNDTT